MDPQPKFRPALLGKQLATYRAQPLPPSTWLSWLGVWGVLLGLPALTDARCPWAAIYLASFGTAATAWVAARRRVRQLDLYQNGFDLRIGKRHRRVCWNQIYEVYQVPLFGCLTNVNAQSQPSSWLLQIIRRDGRCVRLAGFESMHRLGGVIQRSLRARQLNVAIEAYRAGYTVRFGRHFAVGHDGIYVRHQRIDWQDIAEISIDDVDEIRLIPRGESQATIRIASSQVPNLAVLHEFLQSTQREDVSSATAGVSEASSEELSWDSGGLTAAEPNTAWQQEPDETQLLLAGFDWEDLGELRAGELTVEELVARGPRHRPRYPR